MGNPFYQAMGGNAPQNNIFGQFQSFMKQMQGQNPNEILNNLVTSGKVSQQQLNQAQNMARQMQGQFDGMRSMFGFGK